MTNGILAYPFWIGRLHPEQLPLWVNVTICVILSATIVFIVAATIMEKKRKK